MSVLIDLAYDKSSTAVAVGNMCYLKVKPEKKNLG